MVSVPHIIEELKHALKNVVAEESLLETIENYLKTLREIYPSNKHQFTPEHVSFLRNLDENICRQLRSFIELKEEFANVEGLEEYTSLEKRLISIKSDLQEYAICRRVSKEIRELHEKLPYIQEQEEISPQSRISRRIRELEENAPRCQKGHTMVIREKDRGYFWGCSKYPLHTETKTLSPKQKEYLR